MISWKRTLAPLSSRSRGAAVPNEPPNKVPHIKNATKQEMLSCLASVPILVLGGKLDLAGETAKVVFNAYGANAVPMEMMAHNGQLNLSGVLVANDMVTMSGTSFNAMSAMVANLSAMVAQQQAHIMALQQFTGIMAPRAPPPAPPPPPATYRVYITKNGGGYSKACATELTFAAADGGAIPATYISASSCEGCNSCAGCTARLGWATKMFNGVSTWSGGSSNPLWETEWWCTLTNSFSGGTPTSPQWIEFQLPQRPATFTDHQVWGTAGHSAEWRDFDLREQQPDGTWATIGSVTGASQGTITSTGTVTGLAG